MNKTIYSCCLLSVASILLNGCVNRTITEEPQHRGADVHAKKFGSDPHSKVIEEKRVWFWQKEFRNP